MLTAFLCVKTRECSLCITEGNNRHIILLRKPHQTKRLTIAFRFCLTEITFNILFKIFFLAVADKHHFFFAKRGESTNHRMIITEMPVSMKFNEISKDVPYIIEQYRTL